MRQINIHEAKTHLSRLVEEAGKGDSFVIAKSGRPIAKVVPLDDGTKPAMAVRRFDFLAGQIAVPDDFDTMFEDEIVALFAGSDDGSS